MAVTQRLEIRQGQSLVMTPQLQQAIKLLQLSNLELADYVEQELERNPLLERDERDSAGPEEREAEPAAASESETLDTALAREDFSKAEDMDAGHDDMYVDSARADAPEPAQPLSDWTTLKSGSRPEGENSLEGSLVEAQTLKDHLADQLSIAGLDAEGRIIGAAIIDSVDEAGYFRGDILEMAERLGAPSAAVEGGSRAWCRASTPPASGRATWPNAWPCNCGSWTGSIRRCRPCWRVWIWWPGATWPRLCVIAASMPKTLPT